MLSRSTSIDDRGRVGEAEEGLAPDVLDEPAPVAGVFAEDVFWALNNLLLHRFRSEMETDGGFFRVRYFGPTPAELVAGIGPFSPVFDEPIRDVYWQDLRNAIERQYDSEPGARRPRGIHFVHELEIRKEGKKTVMPIGSVPPFSMDVSIDGRGSIRDRTDELELWCSFAIYHVGRDMAVPYLGYASKLLIACAEAVVKVAGLMGREIAGDSALGRFFSMLNPTRVSNLGNHEIDPDTLPEGQALYAFDARARFRGTGLRLEASDATGFLQRAAGTIVKRSRSGERPLLHFSVDLMRDRHTVVFERRLRG
jgi:hypothetical protein